VVVQKQAAVYRRAAREAAPDLPVTQALQVPVTAERHFSLPGRLVTDERRGGSCISLRSFPREHRKDVPAR
jgi:hypothetical protein